MSLASAGVFADGRHCNEQRRLVNELLWRHDQVCDEEHTCACELRCHVLASWAYRQKSL